MVALPDSCIAIVADLIRFDIEPLFRGAEFNRRNRFPIVDVVVDDASVCRDHVLITDVAFCHCMPLLLTLRFCSGRHPYRPHNSVYIAAESVYSQ